MQLRSNLYYEHRLQIEAVDLLAAGYEFRRFGNSRQAGIGHERASGAFGVHVSEEGKDR